MSRSFILIAAVLLASCSREPELPSATEQTAPPPEETAETNPAKGIDWFDGTVDEAFAAARETGKPIYLYWGAEWCPPCHAIAATVFKSPEFIERSRLFIPVYLDGDTEHAQAYGEKFDVVGYPTMVVFSSAGEELTRIPSGIDIQAYANVLDLTLSESAAVDDLVAAAMQGGAELSATDCRLLAYYSWGQDNEILADTDAVVAFRKMYDACPADSRVERSVLYMNWLDARVESISDIVDESQLSTVEKDEAVEQIMAVLADDELAKANIFAVIFGGAEYTRAIADPASETEQELIDAHLRAYDRLSSDDSVYKRERIYTLQGRILFERLHDEEAELSDELQQKIRETVAWADETTPSVYERQPIINALGNVLDTAGMDDVARPLLLKELDVSKQPYYFMVSLADIEQRAGNTDAAIEWLRKAHEAARGPATRFQWGYYYVAGLIEMAPEDGQRIEEVTVGLIDELQNSMGLYQRPKAQLERLDSLLQDWSEQYDQDATLARIRTAVLDVCASASVQDESTEVCESFLESA
jgi:thiol-disulfide isomerase/thioredoxin